MKTLLIKNAIVINCADRSLNKQDIYIEDGKIKEISFLIERDADDVIDADGLLCGPGIVDMHVHMRDPGQTHKEDMFTMSAAAAAGGVTTVLAMPNTNPPVSSVEVLSDILSRAKNAGINILQAACVTENMRGDKLSDFAALKAAGASAFSDDGRPVENARIMLQALKEAAALDTPVLSHAEDLNIVNGGIMNEGEISRRLGVKGIDRASEDASTAREMALAAASNCGIHICHVSTRGSLAIIRDAKRRGVKITCETAPHYFTLTDDALLSRDADYRMNPPLREREDVEAVIRGISDGTIDALATDHAPHTPQEKADFERAPNGIIGLETLLPISYTNLVRAGHIDIFRMFEMLTYNPAAILRTAANRFNQGDRADFVLFDPHEQFKVDVNKLHGKSKNTAFKNMSFYGVVKMTICGGNIIYRA